MIEAGVSVIFWILAFIIIVSALAVVTLKNIFHSALFLILCLFSVAGIYIMLHAEFLAAAQVLIYVGAVSILIIFAIMLTSNLASERIVQSNKNALVAFFVCLMFLVTTIVLINKTGVWNYTSGVLPAENIITIGKLLMTQFMLPFEVVSVLMLAAMIGAIVLAREDKA
ncbi:MAG: NADH-quinone oxidoreductase subunit J [candidate division Zixibacteria bacterium]|nr:NADH-quinone oxidoreductase subunit J [candidate division Zixibacteria bacterium]